MRGRGSGGPCDAGSGEAPGCRGHAPTTLGRRVREHDGGWFRVTDARHDPGLRLERHTHRYPAITLVRRGAFGLRIGGRDVVCDPRGVFFKRGDHEHANEVGDDGASSLILELRAEERSVGAVDLALPAESFWFDDPRGRRLAAQVSREFDQRDSASALALEGLVLELVAVLLREAEAPERPGAAWVGEVEDLLRAHLVSGIGLREVARVVGRHPAHVARTFRLAVGCSVGARLRELRLEKAANELARGELSIAEIATEVGFYDQPHLVRAFKRWAGTTPSAYRDRVRAARTSRPRGDGRPSG